MKIGVDYYPEQWDEEMWEADADRMKEIGVSVVRLAEFAWGRLEPVEGKYDFAWLDQVIRLFQDRNIEVVLGTPTCTPPVWMLHDYPEIIQVDRSGRKTATGIRGHRCLNSPVFREFCRRIITQMVTHYKDWKTVIAYQIDNELEANHCCCDVCQERFRIWLKRKYGSIEDVNRAYGNTVWSGEYSDFEEIMPPMGEHTEWLNPSMQLDFYCYASDSTMDYARYQADLIMKIDPEAKLTTNTWFCEHMPNFYDLFRQMSFVSYDNYPASRLPENPQELYSHAFHLDLMRGIQNKPFWIMEQFSGSVGSWMPMGRTPWPGMIKGYALQAIAHGADAILHFRWRTAKSGAEMYWQGILDPSNVPRRRYHEFKELCQTVEKLAGLEGAMPRNRVAILYSTVQEYAFKIQYQAEGMYYLEQLKAWHDAFTCLGLGVDIIDWTAPLKKYDIVVAPNMLFADEMVAGHLYNFTEQGGTLILTSRTGVKDEHNQCVTESLPSVYRELAGVTVTEYDPLGEAQGQLELLNEKWAKKLVKWWKRVNHNHEDKDVLESMKCHRWCDLLETNPSGTEIMAVYADSFYQDTAAVTRIKYGEGYCVYVGTYLEREAYIALAEVLVQEAGIPYYSDLPIGVEITERTNGNDKWQFIFNNTEKRQVVSIEEEYTLEPFEMKIVLPENQERR